MEGTQKKVGRRVAQLRTQRGMTQDELAEAAGLTVEAISRIERAERAPRLGTLEKLAEGFGVSLSELFSFEEVSPRQKPAYRPDVRRLADQLADQPRAKIQLIAKIAKVIVKDG